MHKIMLVEDDPQLNELIGDYLKRYGYEVHQPNDFMNIENEFNRIQTDLVLLDINLPYFDGYYLCRSFRQQSNIPIIITSARNQELDQILALELGADDYITKPFTFEMLHSRVKATIRRVYGEYATKDTTKTCIHSLCIDSQTLSLSYLERQLELSKNEYKLLKKLMDNHGAFVTREELIEEVWDSVTFVDDNTLTVNMTRIKHKLAELTFDDCIKSKRGVGYMFQYSEQKKDV